MRLLALLLAVASLHGEDFAKWYQRFQNNVAKGNGDAVTERAEFPMDWEWGSTRKIPARSVLVGKFDYYFNDDIKQAVASQKPAKLSSGDFVITWKAKGNEYSMYFKPIPGGSWALFALSEGPP